MGATIGKRLPLRCHPSRPPGMVRSLEARVRRFHSELQIEYFLLAEMGSVIIFASQATEAPTELWRHTCFEAFIRIEGEPSYHELNFAPSEDWAMYRFERYRDGRLVTDPSMRPRIAVQSGSGLLELEAVVRLDALPGSHPSSVLRVGLAAVIETSEGLSYWALRHPEGKPDFHHADGFALRIEPQPSEEQALTAKLM